MLPSTTTTINIGGVEHSRLMHPFTMRFADPLLERQYHDARLSFRLTASQISVLSSAAIWVIFTILNSVTIRDPSEAIYYVRVAGIVVCLASFLATVAIPLGRWIEPAFWLIVAGNILLLTLLLAFMGSVSLKYYPPTSIFIVMAVASFALCGFTFIESVFLVGFVFCAFFFSVIVLWPETPLEVLYNANWLFAATVVAGVGSYLLDRTQRLAWLRQMDLASAEDRIRSLLHNILPPSIASRKLKGEKLIADNYSAASLLFADIVGFTELSSRLSSADVVTMLSELFGRFDNISAKYGLEKIKTIGDCYMVAAGIPEPHPEHLERLTRAALEMLAEAKSIEAPDGSYLEIRIGMHTGAVTAGVIGDAKFIFDVWGDVVNTASRMESYGAAGRIQVTDEIRSALANHYTFEGPRVVDLKGKGPTPVWFLMSAKA
jgi:adenylate cyclase